MPRAASGADIREGMDADESAQLCSSVLGEVTDIVPIPESSGSASAASG